MNFINSLTSENDNSIIYSRNKKDKSEILYSGGCNLVKYNLDTSNMKLLRGHTHNITNLCQNFNGSMIASVDNSSNPNVIIWDANEEKLLKTFTSEVSNITSISFNSDSSLLVLFGLDEHSRTKGVIYDLAAVHQGRDPKLIAKQLTDYDVRYAKFSPIESNVIVSCGRENIRF